MSIPQAPSLDLGVPELSERIARLPAAANAAREALPNISAETGDHAAPTFGSYTERADRPTSERGDPAAHPKLEERNEPHAESNKTRKPAPGNSERCVQRAS